MTLNFNSNKMFFMFILIFSTMISISANSWFSCWTGLEINLLSFIPLISNSNNILSSEASLKYFLTQSLASINFLFSILLNMLFLKSFNMENITSIMMNSSLLMKMGSTPFHFWFPNIMEGLSWFNCFILMTWQKISPLILISYYFNKTLLIIVMIMNPLIGALGGLNQSSLRKLMTFSSINNLGWMISAITISENLWMFYFTIYAILTMLMCFMFQILNLFFLNQIYNLNFNPTIKMSILINFLSLGGLPPFLGFFPKWIIINSLMVNNLYIISLTLTLTSLIMLFFYIRISYSSLMFNYPEMKWKKIFLKNKSIHLLNIFNLISIMGMIIFSTFYFF